MACGSKFCHVDGSNTLLNANVRQVVSTDGADFLAIRVSVLSVPEWWSRSQKFGCAARGYARTTTRSTQHQQLRAVGCVARVTKIADADEPVANPIQQHEVDGRSRGIAGIAYQDRGTSVDESRNQLPVLHERVVAKIFADLGLAVHTGLVDQFEAHLVGEHVADCIEIAGIETVDVGVEQRALGLGQDGQRIRRAPALARAGARGRD